MSRHKPYVTALFDKIAFPSAGESLMESEGGHSVRRTISPFHLVKSGEKALAVRMAQDSGIKFKYVDQRLQQNVNLGKETLKEELARQYEALKEEGWFPEQFDPQEAVRNLEASIKQAIPGLASEDRGQSGGSGGGGGGKRRGR